MNIGEFVLENDEKVGRALNGTLTRDGKLSGGLDKDATDEQILAAYDKLGGLITKGGLKVKMGSFYDFPDKCPREVAEVTFMAEIEGEIVEVTEDEAKAVAKAKVKTKALKAKKLKKK